MNSSFSSVADALRSHRDLCLDLLTLVEREAQGLRNAPEASLDPELVKAKKLLLPRFEASVDVIREHRLEWQKLNAAERAQHREVGALLRSNQDLIMKILLLDRENEQNMLRRGMVPPRHLPSVNRQRPNFVTDLYRRASSTA